MSKRASHSHAKDAFSEDTFPTPKGMPLSAGLQRRWRMTVISQVYGPCTGRY